MDTRLRILKEAGLMFSRYGIRSITMDHIANELGISKRTLYEIFKDKDDLVSQAIAEGANAHKKLCFKIVSDSDNVIEAIFKIGKLNTEMFGKMNPLFFEDLKKFHREIYHNIHQKGELRDYSLTKSLFERGVSEAVFSDNLNMEIVNLFAHKIIDIIHSQEFSEYKPEEINKSVLLPFFYGISTEKGRELITNYLKDFNLQR
jgi:TetR/AcrR family transcriptional regulator, cholesterol catabolism regulator